MSDDKMIKFTKRKRKMPAVRTPKKRITDFKEIYQNFAKQEAENQAGRCSQCGVPYCQIHCPVGNNIPDWLMLVAQDRLEHAYHISSETNVLPEICGRICPQDRLCEGDCVLEQAGHETVTIGAVEKYITDTAFEKNWVKPIIPVIQRNQHVAVIGAGPAGISAAVRLREHGYQVTLYDAYDRVGGLLVYGIPGFKLEKDIVTRRTEWLEKSGVNFVLNCRIGKDKSFAELRKNHDAILIATGVYQARNIDNLPGSDAENLLPALDYLIAANRFDFGDKMPNAEAFSVKDKNVIVLGGGDTAMDCVRTAIRQEAKSVKCLYRRDRDNMPGSKREVHNAEQEGVEFIWLATPASFTLENNEICQVHADTMRLGYKDLDGRQQIEKDIMAAPLCFHADRVITALGFLPEDLPKIFQEKKLKTRNNGELKVQFPNMMLTDLPGVFAAGDIVRGASLVVWAVREGQDAAQGIHQWLIEKAGK